MNTYVTGADGEIYAISRGYAQKSDVKSTKINLSTSNASAEIDTVSAIRFDVANTEETSAIRDYPDRNAH